MNHSRQRVAILGATGHVGKCVTSALLETGRHEVTAVVRDAGKLDEFLATQPHGSECAKRSFEEFSAGGYGAIVNCVGIGTPAAVRSSGAGIFALTERFEQLVSDYLTRRPDTRYVAFGSGAAYCGDFTEPASEATPAVVSINAIGPADYYGIAKLSAEAKHRAARDLAIVDLRLFGLFSRHADLDAGYFMSDVYRAIATGGTLAVGPQNIVRDYIAPADMVSLLVSVLDSEPRNDVFDLYSAAPVAKFDVLEDFSVRYALKYDVLEAPTALTATGMKPNYYSTNRRAASVGYEPSRTSLQTLTEEIDALLELREGGC
ncbi:MAG TPA: NAD-dependent epimerase/dehydratase family protein [Coriobacteriia bacterium]